MPGLPETAGMENWSMKSFSSLMNSDVPCLTLSMSSVCWSEPAVATHELNSSASVCASGSGKRRAEHVRSWSAQK